MKTKTIKQYVSILIAVLFMAMIALTSIFQVSKAFAYSEGDNTYDETYVESDLGQEIMEKGYEMSFDGTAGTEPLLHSFMEYCFSVYADVRNENYGLYIYIYNPGRLQFSEYYGANTINMATKYNEAGEPTDYEIFSLKLCDFSTGRYDYLFYKFRIMGLEDVIENAVEYNTANQKRRYDISKISLLEDGATEHTTLTISKTYFVSGYSKGLATESEKGSTLKIESEELETIELKVKHANYRTREYNKEFVCDELNTVYFAVDEEYFTNYGGLQKIKAEWYEYKTKPIFVTTDQDAYNYLEGYRGKELGAETLGPDVLPYTIYWEPHVRQKDSGDSIQVDYIEFGKSYNHYVTFGLNVLYGLDSTWTPDTRFDWLIKTDSTSGYKVSPTELEDYMTWYTNKYPSQTKIHNQYAMGLFADSIDADRVELLSDSSAKMGRIVQEIDAGESRDLAFKADQSWWDKFWNGVEFETKNYSPIVVLEPGSIDNLIPSAFASQYYISDAYAETVYSDIKAMHDEGKRAVLFRFAETDYYMSNAMFEYMADYDDLGPDMEGVDGYVASETIFLDFEIITLTFRKDGADKVLAVVSDPIDIINEIEGDPNVDYERPESGCASGFDTFLTLVSWLVCIVIVAILFKWGKRIWRWFNGE